MYSNDNPPKQSDYTSAVAKLKEKFDEQQLTAMRAQYSNPGRAITAQELTEGLKYKDIGGANLVYGFLGKLVAEEIGFSVEDRPGGRPGWWRSISTGDGKKEHFTWIMRPEFAEAIRLAGIVNQENDGGHIDAPDVDIVRTSVDSSLEGRKKLVYHLRRERSRGLVETKKASAKSLSCEICGFNSEETYGIPYCEAHHIKPLGDYESTAETKLEDLALVCANCHRIIHSKMPPYEINEVRAMLEKRR